jgi:hypothetical protein
MLVLGPTFPVTALIRTFGFHAIGHKLLSLNDCGYRCILASLSEAVAAKGCCRG